MGGWLGGGVLEGDFLPGEAFQFGDELALAADRGEPVGAEVGEVGFGVRQQVPGDGVDGVADRDQGALFAAAAGEAVVAGAGEGLGAGGADAASPRVLAIQGCPCRWCPGLLLPADWLALGAYLAYDTRWPAVGNRVMSTPISDNSSHIRDARSSPVTRPPPPASGPRRASNPVACPGASPAAQGGRASPVRGR
jgi:hypothetical protein